MATREEAKAALDRKLGRFQPKTEQRTVYLGDGLGFAASNMRVPGQPLYVWARESISDTRFFPILNTKVTPRFNQPVIAGYLTYQPDIEQVIDIDWDADRFINGGGGGSIFGPGLHGETHKFGGGDEAYIDPRQFLEGLVQPTAPPSTSIKISPFTYFYKQWDHYPGSTIPGPLGFKPSGTDSLYVSIVLEPQSGSILYRPGFPVAATAAPQDLAVGQGRSDVIWDGWHGYVPQPAGNEYPLAAVKLTASTTAVDWYDQNGSQLLFSTRLFVGPALQRISERIDGVENALGLGAEQTLPATGAQQEKAAKLKTNAAMLQDVEIAPTAPTNNQVLQYKQSQNRWVPTAAGAGTNTHASATSLGGSAVFKETYEGTHQFRGLSVGANMDITIDASKITLSGVYTDTNTHASVTNLGSSEYGLFKETYEGTHQFKSLLAGTNVTLASNASTVTLTGINTHASAVNLGDGIGIHHETVSGSHQFLSLVAGTNVTLASNASRILISSTGGGSGGGGTTSSGINLQFINRLVQENVGGSINIRAIRPGSGLKMQENTCTIEIWEVERQATATFMSWGIYPPPPASLEFPVWQGPRSSSAILRSVNVAIQGLSGASAWVDLDKRAPNTIHLAGTKITNGTSQAVSIGTDVNWTTFTAGSIADESWVVLLASGIDVSETKMITTNIYYELFSPASNPLLLETGDGMYLESGGFVLLES